MALLNASGRLSSALARAIDLKTPIRLDAGSTGGLFAIDPVSACNGDSNHDTQVTMRRFCRPLNGCDAN